MASIEEKVEDQYKRELQDLGIRTYGKTEVLNESIKFALEKAESKSGGDGNNYPDIQILLEDRHSRRIPVMIEAKGTKDRLIKTTKTGKIVGITAYTSDSKEGATKPHKKGDPDYSTIQDYAVNGALHYGKAILTYSDYDEVIVIGINGSELNEDGSVKDFESAAYYVSEANARVPKKIIQLDGSSELLKGTNVDKLFGFLDKLGLSEEELEAAKRNAEANLEEKVKSIHQAIYDGKLKTVLTTNDKLYLFCGLIMAGLSVDNAAPLEPNNLTSNNNPTRNDGTILCDYIELFLRAKNCTDDKVSMIIGLLKGVFTRKELWRPSRGESILKVLFKQVKNDIIPCFEGDFHLDFTGLIFNSLNDWVHIDNDKANDVVLTPHYVTQLMARLARTDMDSYVWDSAMGSAGFLVSAMDLMIKDAKGKIQDVDALESKIKRIKESQILGIEILPDIYMLAILNMILMGDGSSNMFRGDSHTFDYERCVPATVFLLNPPYSAAGKGLNFVDEALSKMVRGYACVLIQENAGSGQGDIYAKNILKNSTLIASIHMPDNLFCNKSSAQTAIYVFQAGRPHEADDLVKFIDFSEDGYTRASRKKTTQKYNLKDTNDARGRYAEIEAIVLGKKPKTNYYTKENELLIEDTISLNGNDWTYAQHKVIDLRPTEADFKKKVRDFLAWQASLVLQGGDL